MIYPEMLKERAVKMVQSHIMVELLLLKKWRSVTLSCEPNLLLSLLVTKRNHYHVRFVKNF